MKDSSKFRAAMDFVFCNEGGKSNNPNDRGGATNMGVTHSALARAYGAGIVGHSDINALSRSEAVSIYKALFWEPSHAEALPQPFSTIYFDAVVNHGVGGAGKLLQRVLNNYAQKNHIALNLAVDGAAGPKTCAAAELCIRKKRELPLLCELYCHERQKLYERIIAYNPSQAVFRRGWTKRVQRGRELCAKYWIWQEGEEDQ